MSEAATPSRAPKRQRQDEETGAAETAAVSGGHSPPSATRSDEVTSAKPSAPKSRRLEPSFAVRSEGELRSVLQGKHPFLHKEVREKDDFSAAIVVHSHWDKLKFVVEEIVENFNKEWEDSAGPTIFSVNVDDVEDVGDILEIVTYPLPVIVMLHYTVDRQEHTTGKVESKKVTEKSLEKYRHCPVEFEKVLKSCTAVDPVHSIDHLHTRITAAPQGTYTVVWYSASWCPPCGRVLESLRDITGRLPSSVHQVVKADKDHTQEIYDTYDVKLIPTFQVFKNQKMVAPFAEAEAPQQAAGTCAGPSPPQTPHTPIASLQNSQAPNIVQFIDRTCATMKFGLSEDDDF